MIDSISFEITIKIVCLAFILTCSSNINSQDIYSFTRDSKKGLVDNKMNVIIQPTYSNIYSVNMVSERFNNNDYIVFKENKKVGIMNYKEKVILPAEYDRLYPTDIENIFSFTNNDISGLINTEGKKLFAEKQANFSIANSGKSIINISTESGHSLCSIFNEDGSLIREFGKDTLIFPSNYYEFSSDIFIYMTKNRYGYIDAEGNMKTQAIFKKAYRFNNNFAIVQHENQVRIINKEGKFANDSMYQLIKFKESITSYGGQKTDENFYYYKLDGKVGLLDEHLNVIVKPKYSQIGKFNEGLAFVANEDRKYGFIDTKGNEIIPLIYDNANFFSEGLAPVVKNSMWGFINTSNDVIIDFQFTGNMKPFSNGLALFRKNKKTSKTNSSDDKSGYINKKGEFIIEPVFYNAENFKNDVAIVAINGFYYLIDKKGNRFKLYQDEYYEKEEVLEVKY